jgi:hypothetical protein
LRATAADHLAAAIAGVDVALLGRYRLAAALAVDGKKLSQHGRHCGRRRQLLIISLQPLRASTRQLLEPGYRQRWPDGRRQADITLAPPRQLQRPPLLASTAAIISLQPVAGVDTTAAGTCRSSSQTVDGKADANTAYGRQHIMLIISRFCSHYRASTTAGNLAT